MGDTAVVSDSEIEAAIASEIADLKSLARAVVSSSRVDDDALEPLLLHLDQSIARASHPVMAERAAERFARALRHVWLQTAGASASAVYRSPTSEQIPVTAAGEIVEFGYERDLQPDALERRCYSFFPPPPAPWRVGHALFSSGQGAMNAALLALATALPEVARPLKAVHLGSYFETKRLLDLTPHEFHLVDSARLDADLFVIEPISCDGRFSKTDLPLLIEKLSSLPWRPRSFIFDCTLIGRSDGLPGWLAALSPLRPSAVMRVNSGLKLLQAGLELADVGILSVFEQNGCDGPNHLQTITQTRTLLGTGLRFAEVAALEAPWFLDPVCTDSYEAAIYNNNARLAEALAGSPLFEPISHPALFSPAGVAPYCVMRLRSDDPCAYDRLEDALANGAAAHNLLFERGGSFGFRGHRFEAVRPETGRPFLRVAMGRRSGWSCNGVIELLQQIHHRLD